MKKLDHIVSYYVMNRKIKDVHYYKLEFDSNYSPTYDHIKYPQPVVDFELKNINKLLKDRNIIIS